MQNEEEFLAFGMSGLREKVKFERLTRETRVGGREWSAFPGLKIKIVWLCSGQV